MNGTAYVLTRDALVEGTAEHTAMMDKVDPIIAEQFPEFPAEERMVKMKQGGDCQYYF